MSDLDAFLAQHDTEIWSDAGQAGDPEDLLGATMKSLHAMADEFKGLSARLDEQSSSAATMIEQMQSMNKTLMAVLSAHADLGRAVASMTQMIAAPKRIIKDKAGKPIGVEIVRG